MSNLWACERGRFKSRRALKFSLDPKFNGPYNVVDVRGTGIKVQKKKKQKWIHASRCKRFYEGGDTPLITNMTNQGTTVGLSAPGESHIEVDPVEVSFPSEHPVEITAISNEPGTVQEDRFPKGVENQISNSHMRER